MVRGQRAGDPFGAAPALPQQPHHHGRRQRRHAARHHHLRLAGEGDRRRHQHDRIDRRCGQHEGQGGPGRLPAEQPACHGHRAAFASGQRGTTDTGDRHRERRPARQPAGQSLRREVRGHQAADDDAQHQERQGLHEDTAEHRGRGGQASMVGQDTADPGTRQCQCGEGDEQQFHRPGPPPANRRQCGFVPGHAPILPGKSDKSLATSLVAGWARPGSGPRSRRRRPPGPHPSCTTTRPTPGTPPPRRLPRGRRRA
ncbi:Uncharacterised protein [Mycobacteroides abscessus subsp. abscessus]|nr:Uncharacterised protein [Mycobacteroides abscessus subsp. abscessus]